MTDAATTDHRQRNDASRERIAALERLDREALGRKLPNGWSVATTLEHLAFWDRFVLARWQIALRDGRTTPDSLDDQLTEIVNAAIVPILTDLDPSAAATHASAAARAADEVISALSHDTIDELTAQGRPRLVDRSIHRNEHLDEIESALASR
jgi:uncharacterized damage-inducible protein DinB